jgi:hypothetical protein
MSIRTAKVLLTPDWQPQQQSGARKGGHPAFRTTDCAIAEISSLVATTWVRASANYNSLKTSEQMTIRSLVKEPRRKTSLD